MTAFNGMQWIADQIDSILKQHDVAITLYVSVDLSSDATFDYVTERAKCDSRIRILDYGARFGGAAKNFYRLIREVPVSDYEYFAFSDQDDVWHSRKLIAAVEGLLRSGADGYSSNVEAFWSNGERRKIGKAQAQRRWDYLFEAAGPGCTYVFSRSLWLEIRDCVVAQWDLVQNVILHDWFCYAFARAHGFSWIIDEHSYMSYRQHENNQVGMNYGLAAFLKRLKIFMSNQWLSQAKLIFEIISIVETPFFSHGVMPGRISLLKLAVLARHCRRRLRDQVFFSFFCMALSLFGWKEYGDRAK